METKKTLLDNFFFALFPLCFAGTAALLED
jgi:hypothetical protein